MTLSLPHSHIDYRTVTLPNIPSCFGMRQVGQNQIEFGISSRPDGLECGVVPLHPKHTVPMYYY